MRFSRPFRPMKVGCAASFDNAIYVTPHVKPSERLPTFGGRWRRGNDGLSGSSRAVTSSATCVSCQYLQLCCAGRRNRRGTLSNYGDREGKLEGELGVELVLERGRAWFGCIPGASPFSCECKPLFLNHTDQTLW
jgi:hypothetical protein